MSSFRIEGGQRLKGEIIPQGAKNEALQILCACLLTPETVTVSNLPDISDVNKLIELLQDIGVRITRESENRYALTAADIDIAYLRSEDFWERALPCGDRCDRRASSRKIR